jgi:hypothetical protein
MNRFALCACAIIMAAGTGAAGEKKLMHCFAWTPIKEASPADWEAFYKASDLLPQKIKGLTKVWYGKLVTPLSQTAVVSPTPETNQKLRAGETVMAEVRRTPREYGMCMEMADEETLKAYGQDPYHKVWTEAYAKIRVDGTTTFNIVGR